MVVYVRNALGSTERAIQKPERNQIKVVVCGACVSELLVECDNRIGLLKAICLFGFECSQKAEQSKRRDGLEIESYILRIQVVPRE